MNTRALSPYYLHIATLFQQIPDSDDNVTLVMDETAKATKVGDPLSYDDTMSRQDAAEWRKACQAELNMFKKQGLYKEVPKPCNRKIVGCKWVFLTKTGADHPALFGN